MTTNPTVKKLTVGDLTRVKGAQDASAEDLGRVIELAGRFRIYVE